MKIIVFIISILSHVMQYLRRLTRRSLWIGAACALLMCTSVAFSQTVVRVDAQEGLLEPTGTPGDSWTNAFKNLQDALAYVITLSPDEFDPVVIRVRCKNDSTGLIYYPDRDADDPTGTGVRIDTFELLPHVSIFGQYIGGTGGNADPRDPAYLTVLSGAIGAATDTDNSYHVVTARDVGITPQNCRLEGFTITKSYNEGDLEDRQTWFSSLSVAIGCRPPGQGDRGFVLARLPPHFLVPSRRFMR